MSAELEVLKVVVGRLETAGIAYMVSGSMALNYYAQPRMTRDIDIVVALDVQDVERISALFSSDFYCDADAMRSAAENRGMFNLIHTESVIKVDFIVRKDTPYRMSEFARRHAVTVDNAAFWLVSAEDLLLSKLAWAQDSHSERQLADARNLISCVPTLDWPYLERWAADLTVTNLLRDVRT